jgi:uncharacterized repeat protein (TIGR02543 family)
MKKFFVFAALVAAAILTVAGGCDLGNNTGPEPEPTTPAPTPASAAYTVTFNSNGGTAVPTQTVAKGGRATAPADPARAVPGDSFGPDYVFGGWYTAQNLSGSTYDFTTPVTANITLYAKWTGGSIGIAGQSGTLIDQAVAWLTDNAVADTAYTLCLGTDIPA